MQNRPFTPRSRPATTALALLVGLVVVLPAIRGGVDRWAEIVALAISVAAALLATWSTSAVPSTASVLALVALGIGVQLIPVPAPVHGLAPATQATFLEVLGPLGRYPAARPLTLDAPATAREFGKAVACLATFVAAWAFSSTHRRKSVLFGAFALSGVLASLLTLAAKLTGPSAAPTLPFINPNHTAAFLNLTSFSALSLVLRERGRWRLVWAIALAACCTALFATVSRAGIVAFFFGLALFAVRFSSLRTASPRRLALFAVASLCAIGTATYFGFDAALAEFQGADLGTTQKTELWAPAARMLSEHALTGIGRGAFANSFPAYRVDNANVTYDYLENEWVQLPIDLGVPLAALLLGALAWVWVRSARSEDVSTADVGLLAGVAALALHQVFDFGVELMGVSLPLSAALGLLGRSLRPLPLPPLALRACLTSLGAAAAAAMVWSSTRADDVAARIAAAPAGDVRALALEAVELRPGDYLPHAAVGDRLVRAGSYVEALPWLSRAMVLGPQVPGPHIDAARCLASIGEPALARREYSLAFALGSVQALPEALKRWHTLDDRLQLVPETPDSLLQLGAALAVDEPAQAKLVFAKVLDEFIDDRARLPLASSLLTLGDQEGALLHAREHRAAHPLDAESYRFAAWVLVRSGRRDAAEEELKEGIAVLPGSPPLLTMLAELLLARRQIATAKRYIDQIDPASTEELAVREGLAARALAAMGRGREAAERAVAAVEASETLPRLVAAARLLADADRLEEALRMAERAQTLEGAGADDARALTRELEGRSAAARRADTGIDSGDSPAIH